MDDVLLQLDDALRALQEELVRTPEVAALDDLRRMIERADAAGYDQHARSMRGLAARIEADMERWPLVALIRDLGDLMERRAAMTGVRPVGGMDLMRVDASLVRVVSRFELWDEMPTEPDIEE